MSKRIIFISERAMTTTVNDIEHMESSRLSGSGDQDLLPPRTSIDAAVAQVTAISQTITHVLPPGDPLRSSSGLTPPRSILQLGLGSKTLSEQRLYDIGSIS